ncbi:protein TonB [Rheinheimera pacifica]|uniref:energy transducer TonB n=1 Tax=Rheinheimera pacifica TaxID=173990 RepID=UPI002167BDA3|nr:energy transducer TonB [Rheinheimera pacifica]MCS4306794.1 protein TonB [Rheinheimera pacifica]
MLTLIAVSGAHLLPLAWYLAAQENTVTVKPPVLTGVLVSQPASQQTAAPPPKQKPVVTAETQPVVKQEIKPAVKPAAKRELKQTQADKKPAKATEQAPLTTAVTKTAETEIAVTKTAETEIAVTKTIAQPVTEPANPVAKHSHAAKAVPVSAPVLNATAHYNAPPVYPQLSRKLREQGTVVLELTVLVNGTVADVIVLQSSGYPRLDQAALSAVQHWRYQAARRAETAIDYRYRQRVAFSLTEGVN